jgi:UDP-2-acetamido-3-amino-2,3-dideoxy-glucuronate N-acetyltransferase
MPEPSDRAPGLMLGPEVELAEDVALGCHVVIHGGTRVGAGCVIGDHVVLGRSPTLSAESRSERSETGDLVLEEGAQVGSAAVVLAGGRIGAGAVVGDHAFVREGVEVGSRSLVGHAVAIGRNSVIGQDVRIQAGCQIATPALIEDGVFIGPNVVTTNDPTGGRRSDRQELAGPVLRRGCRIGAAAVLMPGVEVGEEAFVGAAALVTRDVPARTVVMGAPAQVRREL